jgi:hypothetical protein
MKPNAIDCGSHIVTTDNLELPRGAEFIVEPGPVENGQLAMIEIGDLETVGRYYAGVADADCIVQPGLLTLITGKTPVRILGPIALIG